MSFRSKLVIAAVLNALQYVWVLSRQIEYYGFHQHSTLAKALGGW